MKILIISDTHKKHKNLERLLDQVGEIDEIIHLGDAGGYEDYIEALAGCPLEVVAGNNDFCSPLEYEKLITIGKYKVFLTHGHYYYVNAGISDVRRVGIAKGADIIMFGHTHVPIIDYSENVVTLNPGSLSYPRQEGRKPSYILMELDRDGNAHFTLNYME